MIGNMFARPLIWALFATLAAAGCSSDATDVDESLTADWQSTLTASASARSIAVQVESNCPWQTAVTTSDGGSWLTVDAAGGRAGKTAIRIGIAENSSDESRTGKVTLSANTVRCEMTVVQQAASKLVVGRTEYDMPAGGGVVELELKTNTEVGISISDPTWIHRTDSRAMRSENLVFSVDANAGTDAREAAVILTTADKSLSETVMVRQQGSDNLILDRREYTLSADAQTVDIALRASSDAYGCEIVYEQASAEGWITDLRTRGMTQHSHRFSVAANYLKTPRKAEIVFTLGDVTDRLTIVQYAGVESHIFRVSHTGSSLRLPDIEGVYVVDSDGKSNFHMAEGTVDWGDGTSSEYNLWMTHQYTDAKTEHCVEFNIRYIDWIRFRTMTGISAIDLSQF